jgi:hypothetical protein
MVGEISYYKLSLKIGMDCRDSGLGWILKKLRSLINGDKDISNNSTFTPSQLASIGANQPCGNNAPIKDEEYEFPLYLDKKSK